MRPDAQGVAPGSGTRPHDHDFSPWGFWTDADDEQRARQLAWQDHLQGLHPTWRLADGVFVSEHAAVQNEHLTLGERTYVAAGAYLTGTLRAGRDCSVNAYTVVRGDVVLGDAVRIGAHTSILGFNHTFDAGTEVHQQPLTSRGISVGDDVWIGSHVVLLDGVTVGDAAVLAAGAVVTKDVPPGAVVGGNPARVLKWRVPPSGAPRAAASGDGLAEALRAFADRARDQAPDVLASHWDPRARLFLDRPGGRATVRAQCDAIEVADLLLGAAPGQLPAAEQVDRLRSWQDPRTGLVGELSSDGRRAPADEPWPHPDESYHVLCVGYALDLLGSRFAVPIRFARRSAPELVAALDALPWRRDAWGAGHQVDALGTALLWNARRDDAEGDTEDGADHGPVSGALETLMGWLLTRADPATGLWGRPTPDGGLLQPVNGYYRTTRGTFAQHGLPVPYPDRVVDTVLAHVRDDRWFRPESYTACNVLDVAHPLWSARSTGHRTDEVRATARRLLAAVLPGWQDGVGLAFRVPHPATRGADGTLPSLQGTEMWLATVWLLADLLDLSEELGYRPRGVHRPEPAA
ncbi:transferase family hexapeptide repeat protein [Isoptericola sp. CG 20/1183]|uniref:Transferase family hexapeptide repeat protein n=1 Tax=Isoptericola halotolerans TaxID=300560 RepID=A0ABX5EJJ1_9MICO|nr:MULTISPECIES: acyltransferase [Isoptericola]PRZ08205.1 transferase family hexapeptide repeat protein [Isoptericola halotolerans]PRZ09002.1 transferase family hexapeptide repeat protein [Isoptericola sp. CG 20/1183]